jgi:hypothetical protein
MVKSITDAPKKTNYLVKGDGESILTLSQWCKQNKVKYNTIQARIWREGHSVSGSGLAILDLEGEHKHLFEKVRCRGRRKAEEGVEG